MKSFLGSRGVVAEHVTGETDILRFRKLYALLNDVQIRAAVVAQAAKRYGYSPDQVELRLYVGRRMPDRRRRTARCRRHRTSGSGDEAVPR